MSKLISKAAKSAPGASVPGAEILSATPAFVELFDLSVIGDGSDTGLRVDGLQASRIDDYAADMLANIENTGSHGFPAIVVVEDAGTSMVWVARGNHRVAAARKAQLTHFPAHVYRGTRRDALVLALGNNADHGAKRTRADMQNELTAVLTDAELGKWSDSYIAKLVKCSRKTVQLARTALVEAGAIEDDGTRRIIDRYGNEQMMNVAAVQSANARTPLTDDEVEIVVRVELARRVTSGRLNDKIAWLVGHRTAAHYAGIIAKDRTTSDEQVLRVADMLRAELEEARAELTARNERTVNRYNANGSFVPAVPASGAEDGDEGTGAPDDVPSAADPAQAPAVAGDDGLAAQVAVAKAKIAELAQYKRLAELLELAVPMVEDLAKLAPSKVAAITDPDKLTGTLYDIAALARSVATVR